MNTGMHLKWMTTVLSIWGPKAHGQKMAYSWQNSHCSQSVILSVSSQYNVLCVIARTPFHADVFRSYSWSANICGRKKWLLYPPGQEEFLRDTHGNLPYDVTSSELQDRGLFPHSEEACQPLEIIQEAGEIIFVPSGWHHQVYNLVRTAKETDHQSCYIHLWVNFLVASHSVLKKKPYNFTQEDTISINHNWLNGCNIDIMWQFLQTELSSVQKEISEWRNTMDSWHQHCQVLHFSVCIPLSWMVTFSYVK